MNAQITIEQLEIKDACADQRRQFQELSPEGYAHVTIQLCEQHAALFDWGWATEHLLSETNRAEYEKVRGPARAEYEKVCDAAWAEYEKVLARAFANLYDTQ